MKDQHKLIKGYRDLSQEEIDLMNKIKELANQVGELVKEVEEYQLGLWLNRNPSLEDSTHYIDVLGDADNWVGEGKQFLQLGFMQLTRAIAKPTSF